MSNRADDLARECETLLGVVLGLSFRLIGSLRFDRRNPQQLYSVCLYSRLVELASGCKAMMEKNTLIGVPILLRSMFEADVDLTNVMRYAGYPKRMYASFLAEKLRLTKDAASPSSPW